MTDLEHHYRQLLASPELLVKCRQAGSVAEFLTILKSIWQLSALSDDALLGELYKLNQQIMDMDVNKLAGQWLPYRYHAKTRSISWCMPDGRATEPFQDQTIVRYREQLVNQLLAPKTTIASLLASPFATQVLQPAGFIFHLSRCGSTLVSGSITELASASVLSESPALTECLLDTSLAKEEQRQLLQNLIQWQARAVAPFVTGAQQLVIKWNAWDIFCWPMIRALYPQVPVLLLVRDPVEILASHQRSVGRHMAGDISMVDFHPVFKWDTQASLLENRIKVLERISAVMAGIIHEPGVILMDYSHINPASIQRIHEHFNLTANPVEQLAIRERMKRHSKEPERQFQPDTAQKQQLFNPQEREAIVTGLMSVYRQLFTANT